jgi:hypothetical protein
MAGSVMTMTDVHHVQRPHAHDSCDVGIWQSHYRFGKESMKAKGRAKTSDRSASDGGDSPSPTEPLGLDERIAIVARLLSRLHALGPVELRTLSVHLRVLSNVAEGWAQRGGKSIPRDGA